MLFIHAVSGCDRVSAVFKKGTKTVQHKVKTSLGIICCLEAFINIDNKKENMLAAGYIFLITLYRVH